MRATEGSVSPQSCSQAAAPAPRPLCPSATKSSAIRGSEAQSGDLGLSGPCCSRALDQQVLAQHCCVDGSLLGPMTQQACSSAGPIPVGM